MNDPIHLSEVVECALIEYVGCASFIRLCIELRIFTICKRKPREERPNVYPFHHQVKIILQQKRQRLEPIEREDCARSENL